MSADGQAPLGIFSCWIFHGNGNIIYTHTLTHLSLDKMAAISQTTFQMHFDERKFFCILIKISLKFVPKGPIYNNQALV